MGPSLSHRGVHGGFCSCPRFVPSLKFFCVHVMSSARECAGYPAWRRKTCASGQTLPPVWGRPWKQTKRNAEDDEQSRHWHKGRTGQSARYTSDRGQPMNPSPPHPRLSFEPASAGFFFLPVEPSRPQGIPLQIHCARLFPTDYVPGAPAAHSQKEWFETYTEIVGDTAQSFICWRTRCDVRP